jgi:hypothetical protein
MKRVKKDVASFPEADAVLAPIGEVLGLVPLEPDFGHIHIVTTFM